MENPEKTSVKQRYEEGSKSFLRLVHAWTQQVAAEGVPMKTLVDCSRAGAGEYALTSTYLSNVKNLRQPSDVPTTKQFIAIAETNQFLERLKAGTQDQPVDPMWRKIPPLTVNGEPADVAALAQVVSGEIRPSEIQRWTVEIGDPELDFELGLRRYLRSLDVTIEHLMSAYAVNNEARQGKMALALMGQARIDLTDRDQETQAIANALTSLLEREVTADQVSIGICSMA